jgi:hypothetical protein
MNCDPAALASASRCWCFPADRQRAAMLYLACQWANAGGAPPCTLPTAPIDLGTSAGNKIVTLTWPAGVGATGYIVKRSLISGGPYTVIGTAVALPYTDLTVAYDVTYYYVVSSTNACGESSGNSIESHAIAVSPPNGVSNLTAVYAANTATQINLAWTDNATNEANYLIYQSIDGGAYSLIATIAANSTSYNDATPTASHTFTYKVAPVNAGGQTLSGPVTPTVASFITTTTGAQTLTIASLTITAAMIVDWGDGSTDSYNGAGVRTHAYAGAGTWTVKFLSPLLVTELQLNDNKITLNSSQIAPIINVVVFCINGLKAGTFNSSDVIAWRPSTFYLYSLVAGYSGTFNSVDVSAWRPTTFIHALMPAGYAGTFNTTDISAWNPVFFQLRSMPTATFTITITAGGFGAWRATTSFDMSVDNISQAQVNQILTDFYTAFATRTASGGTITLNGAGNAAPSGIFQSACPPTSGKETAFDLLNDLCLVNPTKTWATVTTN